MMLTSTETELTGKWEIGEAGVRPDLTCKRIEWLTINYLEKIAASNWETLFQDPVMSVTGNAPTSE